MAGRDLNLVIKDELNMKRLLKFLIFKMKTVDGKKGSGVKILKELNKEALKSILAKNPKRSSVISKKSSVILEEDKNRINQDNRLALCHKVYLKYLIMKVRAKISYHAFI